MTCIPNNTEKYISFSLDQRRFIDSDQFLLASLDKLVAANKPEAFKITGRYEPRSERRELLLRKGVYPYEYMDSREHFAEPKQGSTSLRMTTLMRKEWGDFRVLQPGGLPRSLQPHRLAPPSRRLQDLPDDLHATVRPRSRKLLHQPRPQVGCPAQEDWCGARATN